MIGEVGWTCDTSVLVPALLDWHPDHVACRSAIRDVESLPGHVIVETYSVLSRFPAPHRIAPADGAAVIGALQLAALPLPADAPFEVVAVLGRAGVGGGAVYDGLVGATARHHGLGLLTRDRRARSTYDALGVRYSVI